MIVRVFSGFYYLCSKKEIVLEISICGIPNSMEKTGMILPHPPIRYLKTKAMNKENHLVASGIQTINTHLQSYKLLDFNPNHLDLPVRCD